MPSLKDMRVRIAATKATQKITKAMQMVAASKLRRAQAAAEAARPYAERMEKVLGNIAASVAGLDTAPLVGTSIHPISDSSVDLPEPERPTIATLSPARTETETSLTARISFPPFR